MDTASKIYQYQITLLGQNVPRAVLLQSIVGTLLAAFMWGVYGNSMALYWLMLLFAVSYVRYLIQKQYMPPRENRDITRNTQYAYAVGSGISGLVWGSTVYFFQPATLIEMQPVAYILAGVMTGSIATLSYLKKAYAAFSTLIALPLLFSFLGLDEKEASVLALIFVVYFISCLYFSSHFNKILIESLHLRLSNESLLDTLKQEKEAAEQGNLAKSRFLAAASHDLRQPLHALTLLFDAIRISESEETRNRLLSKIDLSINALSSLFNSLLDISKLDAGAMEVNQEHFSINEILKTPLHEFSIEANKKNITMRVRCGDFYVFSDRILLERIVRNLISNAVRYTDSGGVLISCRRRQDHVLFQVWDTGVGIDEINREKVFNEFHQVGNQHRDRKQGLGLGLSIVKRICDLLDQKIELRSIKGKGTVISLVIPEGKNKQYLTKNNSDSAVTWQINGLEVLLIDDDFDVLEATSILLEKWCCNVTTAISVDDARAKLNNGAKKPELILSDLRLPDNANGIDVINSIRNMFGIEIPAILITGDTEPQRIALAKESGLKVLHKPLKPAQIRSAIHQRVVMNNLNQ